MRSFKLVLEYDGFDYCGWQVQPDVPTIQGTLEHALGQVLGESVRVNGAGRTDAKVHALGQVASFQSTSQIPTGALLRALNRLLPRDVAVHEVQEASVDFHARFSASGKVYGYRILNRPVRSAMRLRYTWHVPQPLDVPAMMRAGATLQGTHDFAAFQAAGSDVSTSVRTLTECTIGRAGDELILRCAADGFLRHMVRNIVGTLVEVGRGARQATEVGRILEGRDRRFAGVTAPPQGLCLLEVHYTELSP